MRHTDVQNATSQTHVPVVLLRVATLALIGLLVTCSTPERRYTVLSTFFDGVPDPNAREAEVASRATNAAVGEEIQYSLHLPWEQRKCELCHEVMFSNSLKIEKSLLCATCHENEQVDGAYVHGPAASGQCYACHSPHKSKFPHLLLAEGDTLCGQCHNEDTYADIELHRAEKGNDCLTCHNPHSSDNAYLIN